MHCFHSLKRFIFFFLFKYSFEYLVKADSGHDQLGLVFDGGLMWAQFRRARWSADGAAVAAASDIDMQRFLDTGQVYLTGDALYTASHYAQLNHPGLHIATVYVLDNVVHVRGWAQADTVFLGLFGVGGLQLNVHGMERPVWGISQEGE